MIETKKLVKRFGPRRSGIVAVDGVTLSVRPGEVLGFLGPNGAGKSTTMKMVTGFLAPTSGSAVVCGRDVVEDPLGVKERVGYLPEGSPAYADMTPEGFLNFVADVRGLRGAARRTRLGAVMERVQLGGVRHQPIETLSKGFKRRVGLAQAILHDPEVLIMDEPTDGLDPNQKHEVRGLIREMAAAGGKTIVLSTHILEEVQAVCTRAAIIARGRIVADGTPDELRARSRYHNAVVVRLSGVADAKAELARAPGVESVENEGGAYTLVSRGARAIAGEVAAFVRAKGWRVEELRVEAGRLDEVFREVTA